MFRFGGLVGVASSLVWVVLGLVYVVVGARLILVLWFRCLGDCLFGLDVVDAGSGLVFDLVGLRVCCALICVCALCLVWLYGCCFACLDLDARVCLVVLGFTVLLIYCGWYGANCG